MRNLARILLTVPTIHKRKGVRDVLKNRTSQLALLAGLLFSVSANALTFILDFTTDSTDIFGERTGAFDSSTYGFTGGLSNADVQNLTLAAVINHYLAYPNLGADPLSPLPAGKELNINFEIGTFGSGPMNGDTDFAFIKIGTGISGTNATDPGVFGAACYQCVRDASGNSFIYPGAPVGSLVGSIWTDHIDDIAYLATNNAELINLIAGTISHEIGHTLSLEHAGAKDTNPGQSLWGVMGSGATAMPIGERIKDREFTYAKFAQLIGAVGLRDITAVPEPGTLSLLGTVLLLMGVGRRRRLF